MRGSLDLTIVFLAGLSVWLALWIRRKRERRLTEQNSVDPETLYEMMQAKKNVLLYDVRQPLDLLANSEIIPGAKRIPPKELMEQPWLLPRDQDTVLYCTCPSDKTSELISRRVRALKFFHVKFLKGGLEAWKAKGYPVEPYEESFRLDTGV